MTPRILLAVGLCFSCLVGQPSKLSAQGSDPQLQSRVKVPLTFNRLYDYPALTDALKALAAGHPELVSMRSIGKSVEGRDLWCLTITNPNPVALTGVYVFYKIS